MPAVVLAVGIGAVTASGCVWYVPALADLRAGADRPVSRRLAAAACVTGWATAACVAVLLLGGLPVVPLAAVTAAGAGAGLVLRIRAVLLARQEQREAAAHWEALTAAPPPPRPHRLPVLFAGTLGVGLALATATAILLTTGHLHGLSTLLMVLLPMALTLGVLAAAILATRLTAPTSHPEARKG
ncbi:hypothetical protein [Streptomyces sp. NPDC048623]|uniref:hypothetical protein n=1 Tax=Streptomyces sp. NPDC048623 TaxID=3155761 RepID=UPI00343AAA50